MREKMTVLIVSYYFPPSGAVGAKRVASLCESLVNAGHTVDVLCGNWRGIKISGVTYVGKEIVYGGHDGSRKHRKLFQPSAYFRSIDRTVFSSFLTRSMKYLLDKRMTDKGAYSVVIASYKPAGSILAGILASLLFGAPLVIELRDLISIFGRKKRKTLFDIVDRLLDRLMMGFADRLVVVSPTAKRHAERFYKREVELIFNGIDEFEVSPPHDSCVLYRNSIFYAGSLSDARRLDKICRFIREYKGKKVLRLVVASEQDPMMYGGDPAITEWIGFVDRQEIYERQKQSDYLLILEGAGEDSMENIPAKLFEYLGACRPIIADCNPESDIGTILKDCNRGFIVSSAADFAHAVDYSWKMSVEDVHPYLRRIQNAKYIQLIDELGTR